MTVSAQNLYDLLSNGEIDEQTFTDTLEAIGTAEKLESYCHIIRQLEADAEMLKAEKERIASKQRVAENSIARMKTAIASFMKAQNTEKSSAGIFTVALSRSKAVNITDESKVPARFLVEQAPKIDKAAIRNELLAGGEIEGCELQINEGVRIK
jgi:hypothetical protein